MDNSYAEINDASTIYKFPVKAEAKTFLLAWSTTPWNKLATPALAVNPKYTYVKVKQGDEFYILAKNTLKILNPEPYKIVATYAGKDLEKLEFVEHFQFFKPKKMNVMASLSPMIMSPMLMVPALSLWLFTAKMTIGLWPNTKFK